MGEQEVYKKFNFIITLTFGETNLLSTQYRMVAEIVEEFGVNLASMTGVKIMLQGKILWFLHLRTQAFLRSCSDAITVEGV